MTKNEVMKLYEKERDYEETNFGNYKTNKNLNLASFLVFLESYIQKAKKNYTQKWDEELPQWLLECVEFNAHGVAPANTYECLIEIMTLAGAALETYSNIDVEKWRNSRKET